MWNESCRLRPIRLMPFPNVPGISAATVIMTSGDQPEVWRMPNSGGGLPSPVPGMSVTSASTSGSRACCTASRRRSSGTAKSKSGSSFTGAALYP